MLATRRLPRCSALVIAGVILAGLPGGSCVFQPKWSSSPPPSPPDASSATGITSGESSSIAGGGGRSNTCGASYPADTPMAPTYRQKINIPSQPPPPDRSSEVAAARCTLHAPPGTSFRHGVTVGFTVTARNSAGAAIPARQLPFVFNVTNVGDSSSGTVFDLQNGTYFVYSTVYFSPELLEKPAPQVWVRLHGQHIQGSPFEVPLSMDAISQDFTHRVAASGVAGP